jgi:hypothetical protein
MPSKGSLVAFRSSMTRRSQAPRPRFLFCVECSSRGTDSDRDDEALVPVPRRWAVLNRPSGPVTFKLEAKGSHASENYVTPWACAWSLVPSTMNSCLPSCRAGAEHLGTISRPRPSTSSSRHSVDRTLQDHASGLVGCTRKQGLAASWSVRPFGPVPSSMRVDPSIDHQVCIRFTTTRSQS